MNESPITEEYMNGHTLHADGIYKWGLFFVL
jgi:hypothetical protein